MMTILAGYCGVAALAAHTSVVNVFVLIFMISGGVSCAAAALVGNAIGAGSGENARRSATVSVLIMLAICVFIDCGIYVFMQRISRIFTDDESVDELTIALLHTLLIIVPLDCLQTVIDGILRGLGKQALAFKVKLCCMWGLRFPLGILLAFHAGLGVNGIWLGNAVGLAATLAIYIYIAWGLDWTHEVIKAAEQYKELINPASPGQSDLVHVPGMCRSPTSERLAWCNSPVDDQNIESSFQI